MSRAIELNKKYDTLVTERIRNKDRIIRASRRIDLLRERLSNKIKNTDSAKIVREMRNNR